jgi:hypothetical protein
MIAQKGQFVLEIEDARIIVYPKDNFGRQMDPLNLSIESAESLMKALGQAVTEAKIKSYN